MGLLVAMLAGIIISILAFAVVLNWTTGQFKPKSNLGFMLVVGAAIVGLLFFPKEPLQQNLHLMKLILLPGCLYIAQVMWYIGPLQPLRQRRLELLCTKWQKELDELLALDRVAHDDPGIISICFDRHQRIQYLRDKLKNVTV